MKKGLILEGGAMRGMYTAGVLDIFMENDITVDGAIGIEAEALNHLMSVASPLGQR